LDPNRPHINEKIEQAKAMQNELRQLNQATKQDRGGSSKIRMSFEDEMNQALEHQESDQDKEAEDIYRSILKRDPNHVEAARLLARIAMDHERYGEAEIFLTHALQNAPDYARAWIDLVNAQQKQDKLDEATASAIELLKITPDSPESHMMYAGVIGSAGHHEEAIIAYKKAISLESEKPGAFSSMAHHLKTIGRTDEAIAAYRQSLTMKKLIPCKHYSCKRICRMNHAFMSTMLLGMNTNPERITKRHLIISVLAINYAGKQSPMIQ
jgi:tetratricopeptide (TPR) repeat protein